jgi:nicotinamidase-related amidase
VVEPSTATSNRRDTRLDECALIVIDVQRGFDDPQWGRRNNPECEANLRALIGEWRRAGRPVVFVRHDSREPGSPLAPGTSGNGFKDGIDGEPDLLVVKHVNSAFYGIPDLHRWLQGRGLGGIAIGGIQTNMCCETTARMAGNLGYRVWFVADATHTFDRVAPDGGVVAAEELQRVTETNLDGEFANVVSTGALLSPGSNSGRQ